MAFAKMSALRREREGSHNNLSHEEPQKRCVTGEVQMDSLPHRTSSKLCLSQEVQLFVKSKNQKDEPLEEHQGMARQRTTAWFRDTEHSLQRWQYLLITSPHHQLRSETRAARESFPSRLLPCEDSSNIRNTKFHCWSSLYGLLRHSCFLCLSLGRHAFLSSYYLSLFLI